MLHRIGLLDVVLPVLDVLKQQFLLLTVINELFEFAVKLLGSLD
jgi:hypothetical protein